MFHQMIHVILILVISVTHVHPFAKKFEEIRPRYRDEYNNCLHGICDQVKEYPEKKILEAINNKESLKSILGVVLNSSMYLPTVENRDGFDVERKQLCRTVGTTTHTPRVMKNILSEWKYVINVEGYRQIFTSETCKFEMRKDTPYGRERQVNLKIDHFSGEDFECKQIKQEIYLLVFEDGIIDYDRFRIPTICSSVGVRCNN